MSSSILHHCPFCGQFTDISIQLAAFIENPSCGQCGLSASESNVNMQDELSILFAKQMTMDSLDPSNPPTRGHLLPFASPPGAAKITYSVSQHYHHSSHVASRQGEPSEEDAVSVMSADPSVADILRGYNIDPLSLSSDQLGLFDRADQEQRARLVQMWQICGNSHAQTGSAGRDFEMNDSMQEATGSTDEGHYAEPYMVSGYESLRERDPGSATTAVPNEPSTGAPYRQASDPVYQGQRWWETGETSHMENQYGNFEQRAQFIGCGVRNAHWL